MKNGRDKRSPSIKHKYPIIFFAANSMSKRHQGFDCTNHVESF